MGALVWWRNLTETLKLLFFHVESVQVDSIRQFLETCSVYFKALKFYSDRVNLKTDFKMKVKLFILFSIIIVLLGFVIYYYGFPMLNAKHKPGIKKVFFSWELSDIRAVLRKIKKKNINSMLKVGCDCSPKKFKLFIFLYLANLFCHYHLNLGL